MTKIAEILHTYDFVQWEVELEGMENCILERFCYLAGLRQKQILERKESPLWKFQETKGNSCSIYLYSDWLKPSTDSKLSSFIVFAKLSDACMLRGLVVKVKSLLESNRSREGRRILGLSLFWLLHEGITHNVWTAWELHGIFSICFLHLLLFHSGI